MKVLGVQKNRLTIKMLLFCMLTCSLQANQYEDLPEDAIAWTDLAKQKNEPPFVVATLSALLDGANGSPVVLWNDITEITLKIPLPAAGRYTIKIAHLTGPDFAPFVVSIPQGKLGTVKSEFKTNSIQVSQFQTPLIPGQYLEMTLKLTKPSSSFGIQYIQPIISQYEPVEQQYWKRLETKQTVAQVTSSCQFDQPGVIGYANDMVLFDKSSSPTGRIEIPAEYTNVAVTHFYFDTAFTDYSFELSANNDATLYVNGLPIILLRDGTQQAVGRIPWNKLNRGLNRIAVVMPSSEKRQKHWFELGSSVAQQIPFYSYIPEQLDTRRVNDDWPSVSLSNASVKAVMPLPDPTNGYYRSVRFEAAGQLTELSTRDHQFFTSHLPIHDPLRMDAAAGTASEFLEPAGYEDISPGQTFMKIGVGLLRKSLDHGYFSGTSYLPVQFFDWKSQVSQDAIHFSQDGDDSNGHAYHYEKRFQLTEHPPGLVIKHQLTNTGKKRIQTSHYTHNFLAIDQTRIDPNYQLKFAFHPMFARDIRSRMSLKGNIATPLDKGTTFTEISGFSKLSDSVVTVHHQPSNLQLLIRLDQPMYRFWLYASDRVLCPEMFTRIDLSPGQTKRWVMTYEIH